MDKKVILISTGTRDMFGQPAFVCNATYLNAVSTCGAVPLIVGLTENAQDYFEMADGLILTGGESVHPRYFGETFEHLSNNVPDIKHRMQKGCNVKRDELEMELFRLFKEAGKPILGICRGHQLVNAAMGGKNALNFPLNGGGLEHNSGIPHKIHVEEGSLLYELYGSEMLVNSFHQDCAVSVGPDMKITAKSEDDIIEATQHQSLPIFTTQWHPERMRGDNRLPALGPNMQDYFQYFIDLCEKH